MIAITQMVTPIVVPQIRKAPILAAIIRTIPLSLPVCMYVTDEELVRIAQICQSTHVMGIIDKASIDKDTARHLLIRKQQDMYDMSEATE